MKTLLICAMREEFTVVEKILNLHPTGTSPWEIYTNEDNTLYALISGVGKVYAATALAYGIEKARPDRIIAIGVAGALNPDYRIGDIVISQEFIQYDMDLTAVGYSAGQLPGRTELTMRADGDLIGLAEKAGKQNPENRIHTGLMLTGDRFVSADWGLKLRREFMGDTVDMESAAWSQVAEIYKLPFLALRSISDQADHAAPVDIEKFGPMAMEKLSYFVRDMLTLETKQ